MAQRLIHAAKGFAFWAALSGLSFAAPPVAAQAPAPQGGEFQVNTYTTNQQFNPSVAADADGDFVVVWTRGNSLSEPGNGENIQGQRYASNGSPQGAEFQVNTYTTGHENLSSVAVAADGDFVVVWESGGSYISPESIRGQRYASNGSPQGAEFQVNTYTTGFQRDPSVAAAADGDFVVVWFSQASSGPDTEFSIQGQRYASNGSAQGSEFQVNTFTTSGQFKPSVAADPDGDFVVVWQSAGSYGTDTESASIQGQRYASNGSPQGDEFQVNTFTQSYQGAASVAADADGDFVVVWQSAGSYGTDTDDASIQGQRFASDGSPQGAEFQVNTYTTSSQLRASVSAAASGGFVVVWASFGSSGTDTSYPSVQGQRYASNGSPQGAAFQVNTYTTFFQDFPSVAAAGGEFVVVWDSDGSSGTDTTGSIQGQRYIVAARSVSHIFQILGTSNAVPWSWRIADAGSTAASAISVGPVTNGGGPDLFATEFINSINSNSSSSACLALATSNTDKFEVRCPYAFRFFVNDAPGTGTECEVTGTLGGSGCPFNPTIVEVARAVPALSPAGGIALVTAVMLLGAALALRRR